MELQSLGIFFIIGILINITSSTSCEQDLYVTDQTYITSPNYGQNRTYPISVTCQWTVTALSGKKLQLNFLEFEVEYHALCAWDYLAVAEGDCPSSFRTRYCGGIQHVPKHIFFEENKICLKFVSDFVLPKRGFQIAVSISDSEDTALIPEQLKIPSTNYSQTISNEQSSASSMPASLSSILSSSLASNSTSASSPSTTKVTTFLTPASSSSPSSPLSSSSLSTTKTTTRTTSITSGSSTKTTTTATPIIPSTTPMLPLAQSPKATSSLTLALFNTSTSSRAKASTKAISSSSFAPSSTVTISKASSSPVATSLSDAAIRTLTSSKAKSSNSVEESFTTIVPRATSSPEMVVTVCPGSKTVWVRPNTTVKIYLSSKERYLPNSDCAVLFQTSDKNVLKIEFVTFDVELHPDCHYHRVSIIDGDDVSSVGANKTLCGPSIPDGFVSSGSSIVLKFSSYHVLQRTGFMAFLKAIPLTDAYPGTVTAENLSATSSATKSFISTFETKPLVSSAATSVPNTHSNVPKPAMEETLPSSTSTIPTSSATQQTMSTSPTMGTTTLSTAGYNFTMMPIDSVTSSTTTSRSTKSLTESKSVAIDICSQPKIQVEHGIYLLSPGRATESNYPVNRHCSIQATSEPNEVVRIKVVDFDVEYHSSCMWDYLEIFANNLVVGRFCGQDMLSPIETATEVTIVFHSDHIVPKKGFKLYIDTIAKTTVNSSVELTTVSNVLEESNKSLPQEVETSSTLTDHPEETATLFNTSTQTTVTERSTVHPNGYSDSIVTTLSQSTNTTFEANFSIYTPQASGNLLPTHVPKDSNSINLEADHSQTTTDDDFVIADVCQYSMISVNKEVQLISPGKMNNTNYPLNKHCMTEISCKKTERLKLEFKEFDIEYHSSCAWDYIELLEENNVTLGRFCGSSTPHNITVKSYLLKLVFHSDFIVAKKGFKASLYFEEDGSTPTTTVPQSTHTGHQSTERNQASTLPNVNQGDADFNMPGEETDVAGSISTEVGWPVAPEVESSRNKNLTGVDTLSETVDYGANEDMFDGSGEADKVVNGVNKSNDDNIPSHGVNFTTIQGNRSEQSSFATSSSITNSLSSANPSTKSSNGTVNTPTSDYKNATNETLTYPFLEILTTDTPDSSFSPSTLLNSSALESLPLTNKPSTSSNPITTLENVSPTMPSEPGNLPENCKGDKSVTLVAKSGYITSPGFENNQPYPPNILCNWEIDDQNHELIMLLFQSFNVEKSKNCRWDKVAVYEEGLEESNKLGVFCGDNIPPTITSSKRLFIQFVSDTIVENLGFKLMYKKTTGSNLPMSIQSCPAGKTPCFQSGSCIPVEWLCDGEADCNGGEDELDCDICSESEFSCGDGSCIPLTQTCSGVPECPYGADEVSCASLSRDDGVIINKNGKSYSLCYNGGTTEKNYDVVCQAAGYRYAEAISTTSKTLNETVSLDIGGNQHHLTFEPEPCDSDASVSLHCHDKECGMRNNTPVHKRIIGGSLSSAGEWPWIVAVEVAGKVICGGTIVSEQWIITAGHCIDSLLYTPNEVYVIAGTNDLNDAERQIHIVTDIQLHPDYNFIYNADIALLRLQRPLKICPKAKTICLPWDKREFSPSSYCYIAGWGVSDLKDYFQPLAPQYLRHTKTKIVTVDLCRSTYSYKMPIKDTMMCAGFIGGDIDACKGDSGGSLVCETQPGRWTLAGVISWGEMCGSFNKPGVYTKVSSFLPWIDQILGRAEKYNASCTFESGDWCGYEELSAMSYLWSRLSGGKSYTEKPIKDQTFGNKTGHFMYTVIGGTQMQAPVTAILQSPKLHIADFKCLTFAYIYGGKSSMSLSVFGIPDDKNEEKQLLWTVNQTVTAYSGKWRDAEVTLPAEFARIQFVAQHYSGTPGIGIDDVFLTSNSCSGLEFLHCSFNDATFCGYEHELKNYNPFEISMNPDNNSDLYASLNNKVDTFSYLKSSLLLSPRLPGKFKSVPHCLTFQYKVTLAKCLLTVVTFSNIGDSFADKQIHWTSQLGDDLVWYTTKVNIYEGYFDRFGFEAILKVGEIDGCNMAFDDLNVYDGNCI